MSYLYSLVRLTGADTGQIQAKQKLQAVTKTQDLTKNPQAEMQQNDTEANDG